jgi:hypothetical protein
MALDVPAMTGAIQAAIAGAGVVTAWDGLIAPVLRGIGRKHAATGECVEVEHLLSTVVLRCLAEVAPPAEPLNPRPVLLACAPEEQHDLPVHALAAALAQTGVATVLLGARVPAPALAAAIRRTGPHALLVWSQTARTGDPAWLARLPRSRPAPRVLVGGPGWKRRRLPAAVRLVTSLPEAVAEIRSALVTS